MGDETGTGDERRDEDDQAPAGSVFGNLPSSRPGVRSPRRDPEASFREAAAEAAPTEPEPKTPSGPADRDPPEPPTRGYEPEATEPRGLEDIAWAGVAAAAEAATLSVRLATRALERLRDGVDRR